jgi:hypothetical protein
MTTRPMMADLRNHGPSFVAMTQRGIALALDDRWREHCQLVVY